MAMLSDWLPPLFAALTFTFLGACKVYGWRKNVVGGGGRPWTCRLQGRCPSWSKEFHLAFTGLLFVVGLLNFALVARVILAP